jgi:hypothetical protein
MHFDKLKIYALSGVAGVVLLACGGGSSDPSTNAPSALISGVAAFGAPLSNATITVLDANGKTASATADAQGKYSVNVAGFVAPVLISATGTSGGAPKTYAAILDTAPAAGSTATANVTPLTYALVTMVSTDGTSPNEFSDATKLKNLDAAKLATALTKLQTALSNVLSSAGLPASFDPTKTTFVADRTSAADVLLDTIKVTNSDQGVTLTNVLTPISNTDTGATGSITIKGTTGPAPTPLPPPTQSSSDLRGLDTFVTFMNGCLAQAPDKRVVIDPNSASNDSSKGYTFLGNCRPQNTTLPDVGVSDSYLQNGYEVQKIWGDRIIAMPSDAKASVPEVLTFTKGPANEERAIVRLPFYWSKGGIAFIDTMQKNSGKWQLIGNQRNYNASVSVRMYRGIDASTNEYKVPIIAGYADSGKKVGRFDNYRSALIFSFDQSGPNGSDVLSVRVKGPGLPTAGVVLARSSSCGTSDYLGFHNNAGIVPTATSLQTLTTSTSNSWGLDLEKIGTAYTGTDFYNQLRGLNTATGAPTTSTSNNYASTPVNMSTIPEFAQYSWEVFTVASGTAPASTFTARITTRPLAAKEGNKLPWADLTADAKEYIQPTVTTKAGALATGTMSWSLPTASTPIVTSAYIFGDNRTLSSSATFRLNMGTNVANYGDTTLALSAAVEKNGLGTACNSSSVPSFSATTGYREIGTRQLTDRSLTLQSYIQHIARP